VRIAVEWSPDVVLCDIGLPGTDGFAVAEEIRKRAPHGRIRLIAVTGYGREEDIKRAFDAGFDHHIVKPADPESLLASIAR
jgi:CheY-like chemotaxis protein